MATNEYISNFVINQYIPLCKKHKVFLDKAMPEVYLVKIIEMQENQTISKQIANELIEYYVCLIQKLRIKIQMESNA